MSPWYTSELVCYLFFLFGCRLMSSAQRRRLSPSLPWAPARPWKQSEPAARFAAHTPACLPDLMPAAARLLGWMPVCCGCLLHVCVFGCVPAAACQWPECLCTCQPAHLLCLQRSPAWQLAQPAVLHSSAQHPNPPAAAFPPRLICSPPIDLRCCCPFMFLSREVSAL